MLIEFFFHPDILSIQEVSASPIVQLDCGGKSSILYDNGCPKKHTQILPLAPQGGANVGRVVSENIQTLEGKEGANYALFGGGGALKILFFFLIQNIYFLRGSEFQYQNMANTEGRLFSLLFGIFSSK